MENTIAALLNNQLILSCILFFTILALREIILHFVRGKQSILSERQRRWSARTKLAGWMIILIGLTYIWLPEVRTFAFSIAAVAVALVIATKELILCFSGAIMRAASGAFAVGDWVEIGHYRGEVIDYNLFSTTLQELDRTPNKYEFTGKTIIIPNSLFLSQSIKNLNFSKRYVFHRFDIYLEPEVNIFDNIDTFHQIIDKCTADFIEVARRYNAFIENRIGVDVPGAEPRIFLSTNDQAKQVISIIIFCPSEKAVLLEQQITSEIMNLIYSLKTQMHELEQQHSISAIR